MGRNLNPPTAKMREITSIVQINKGGTSADDAIEAAANLGAISTAALGLPNGPVVLDNFARLPASSLPSSLSPSVTLGGRSSLFLSEVAQYTITNFDATTTYTISASAGVISRSGAVITYTAPGVPGNYTITVNGRAVTVTVDVAKPVRPTIALSTSGNASSANIDCTGSVFAMQSGTRTHISTDWEVSVNPDFQTTVSSSYNDTVNRTSFTASNLVFDTTYFVRARYRASTGEVSDWSVVVALKTRVDYTPSTEEARQIITGAQTLPPSARIFSDNIDISNDGSRMVVGYYRATSATIAGAGLLYVFVRTGSNWSQEAVLNVVAPNASMFFGYTVEINADGSRLVVGAPGTTVTQASQGAVYVYVRTGSSWALEQRILNTDSVAALEGFGSFVSIDAGGTRVIIGAPNKGGALTAQGMTYVWSRNTTNNVWSQEARLLPSDPTTSARFGTSVSLSADGSRAAVSAIGATANSTASAGAVYIYTRNDTTWTQEAKLVAADQAANTEFGRSIKLSANANYIVVGSPAATISGMATAGAAYVYTRSGITWSQTQKLVSPSPSATSEFAASVGINSDGSMICCGAYRDDPVATTNAGVVNLYNRTGQAWSHNAAVTASDRVANHQFGASVALSADGVRMAVSMDKQTTPYLMQTYIFR